jgi:methanogenic corrinoid protein MtbC1
MPDAPTTSLTDEVRSTYWEALARGDRSGAVAIALAQLDRGFEVGQLFDELVRPAQLEVGRQWAVNSWGVAREHVATSISEDVVSALAARAKVEEGRGEIVVTCVEGEWHALPARIFAEAMRLAGWRVSYLGASVPTAHLAAYLHDLGPDLTALSCSVSTSLHRARRMIEASRSAGIPVLTGGRGFGADGRWAYALGANGWAPDPAAALDLIEGPSWPSYTDAAPALTHPDDAHLRLREQRAHLVQLTMKELTQRHPEMAADDADQRSRTLEDLEHILDFLATALYLDDVALFAEFLGWLGEVLGARGVPPSALELGLEAVDAAIPTALPRAHAFVRQGTRLLRV